MSKKKQKKLSVRMTIYCIIFAGLLSIVIGGLGIYTYYINSIGHYEAYITSILHIARDAVDGDEIAQSIQSSELSEGYDRMQEQFNSINTNSTIEYIYMITPAPDTGYMYVMCGYTPEELENPQELTGFGDRVQESEIASDTLEGMAEVMRGEAEEKFIVNTSELGYFMSGVVAVKDSNGTIVAVLSVDTAMEDIENDMRNYVIQVLAGTCIMMVVFLLFFLMAVKKKIVKPVLALGKHADEFVNQTKERPSDMTVRELHITTGDEIEALSRQLNKMMKDMAAFMSDLESVAAEQERNAVQMNVTKQIQKSMMPSAFPAFPERTEFNIYAVTKSVGAVSGDFYDFFMTDGTHLGIIVADVSGEGVPAALFMMIARTLIRNYSVLGMEPAKVFIEANNELCANNDAEMTVSAFMGILDVYNGSFTYVSAGEFTPLIKHKESCFEQLPVKQGYLLGTLEKIPFYQEHTILEKGDILCLFTEGIEQLVNNEDRKFSVRESLNRVSAETAEIEDMLHKLIEDAEKFSEDRKNTADMTAMAVAFKGINM